MLRKLGRKENDTWTSGQRTYRAGWYCRRTEKLLACALENFSEQSR